MRIIIILGLLLVGQFAYMRFAPASVAKFHQLPQVNAPGDVAYWGGYLAVRPISEPAETVLAALQDIALNTDRTLRFAGRLDEGMITFQSRTKVLGIPDYTTVAVKNDLLFIYGRLRFSYYDQGVNKARVLAWLDALGPLTAPL